MITLNDSWLMYKTKDGKYCGYFEIDSQPDDWIDSNTYYVTCEQFLDYYYYMDASCSLAASITSEHFRDKAGNLGLAVEFEDITISKLEAINWVIAALSDDKNHYVDSYGENYEDWQNFEGVISVLTYSSDFCVIVEDNQNNEIVEVIYKSLGLTTDKDIYEYELDELSLDGLEKLRRDLQ